MNWLTSEVTARWLRGVMLLVGLGAMLLVGTAHGADAPPAASTTPIDFEQHVLPLLKQHCYECHDGRKQTASFRLDLRATAQRGGESGVAALVAGHPEQSELYARIISTDTSLQMPPEGPRLSAEEADRIRVWIAQGAVWPDHLAGDDQAALRHWAFMPPVRPAVPSVGNEAWVQSPIDRFVLSKLEHEHLPANPPADRTTLIRRLSLDLTGLPPTVEEVDAFLADNSPDAYANLVERLLASPHYGERWGRLWLDAARYADSDGYEKDKPRFVWFYRDWVINALNRDLPYDQFIIEQLAGDQLPHATQDQLVATGFLRNSMINEEGGVDPEQFRMEAMFDRMDAIGKGILGLTVQCAQCHDHKYDPISQAEYYGLFAYFNDCHEASIAAYTPEQQARRDQLLEQIAAIEASLRQSHRDAPLRVDEWVAQARQQVARWQPITMVIEGSPSGQKVLLQDDSSYLCGGYAPTLHEVMIGMPVRPEASRAPAPARHGTSDVVSALDALAPAGEQITAFQLELMNEPNLPLGGPGRSIFGTGALTEFKVRVRPLAGEGERWVKFARAWTEANPPETPLAPMFDDRSNRQRVTGPIEYAIDGKDETAWTHDLGPGRRNQAVRAIFVPDEPIDVGAGVQVDVFLVQRHGGWNSDDNQNYNLGRFRISYSTQPGAKHDQVPQTLRPLLAIEPKAWTSAERAQVFSYWRTLVPEWADANAQIEALWRQHPEPASQLTLAKRDQMRPTFLLKRGDFLKPGEQIAPSVPIVLASASSSSDDSPVAPPRTRLELARWLTRSDSPTTARALVNRVWQAYFGTGIVSTAEDLGRQCDPPSHPELLDWLATEFVEQGWSLKQLQRLIVLSSTYQQSSHVRPDHLQHDPANRLLARGARYRLEGELVRDAALAASGLLQPKVGGPSVYPPLPEFMLLPPVSYGPKMWHEEKGPDRYRRSLYTFRYRSLPYPVLQTFDAPNGDFACVRRSRSNTPLQALMTLNEPVFVECAVALANTALATPASCDADRLTYAFRRCVARPPTSEELSQLQSLLAEQRAEWGANASGAETLVGVPLPGLKLPEPLPSASERAAWTIVARVLLNLDETVSRE